MYARTISLHQSHSTAAVPRIKIKYQLMHIKFLELDFYRIYILSIANRAYFFALCGVESLFPLLVSIGLFDGKVCCWCMDVWVC